MHEYCTCDRDAMEHIRIEETAQFDHARNNAGGDLLISTG